MSAFFMSVPVLLKNNGGLAVGLHGWVYLPVLFLSFVAIIPVIILAEKKRRMKGVFVSAVAMLVLSMIWLSVLHGSLPQLIVGLSLFFIGFNLLEALLPSLVSKISPAGSKGTAMGIYSTSQFLGACIGSPLGAALSGHLSASLLFAALALMAVIWLLVAARMAPPPFLSSIMLSFDTLSAAEAPALAERLRAVGGVEDVVVLVEEKVAYLKVDKRVLDEAALQAFPAKAVAA